MMSTRWSGSDISHLFSYHSGGWKLGSGYQCDKTVVMSSSWNADSLLTIFALIFPRDLNTSSLSLSLVLPFLIYQTIPLWASYSHTSSLKLHPVSLTSICHQTDIFAFKTGSHHIAGSLEPAIFLLQLPQYWVYWQEPGLNVKYFTYDFYALWICDKSFKRLGIVKYNF